MKARDYTAIARAYARDVTKGKIPACAWVKLACQRHLDDLAASKEKSYPFKLDPAKANRACAFVERFPHVKGRWAVPQPGAPAATNMVLEPWQCFTRTSIFGWVEKNTGFRRFRTAYIEVPRKNGKSIEAASSGLYMFAADKEFGAEVYSGATTEKQAWEVFRPARLMAERTPAFLEAYGVEVHAKTLTIAANGSRFEPVIGKPGDGASPSLAIVDEYHEHADSVLFDTMATGMAAREQPLILVITTAGDNLAGPCYDLHRSVEQCLQGVTPNDRLFGVIYTIDEGVDWSSEEALRMANPNYGVSVSPEFLRHAQQEALDSSRKQGIFKTKHLNIWVTARSAWLNMEWWHRQKDEAITRSAFAGADCWMGLDLASKTDLAAAVLLFRKSIGGVQHYYLTGRYYCPESAVDDPSNKHYQGWVYDDYLIETAGSEIHQEQIKADILQDAREFQIREIAFDEWGAIKLVQELEVAKIPVVRIPQNARHLSDPMKELEAAIKSGRLWHDGNPCMTWMMSNVTAKELVNDNVFPRKERHQDKIDGPVAAIMALSRAIAAPDQAPTSVYESRGLLRL